MSAAVAFSYNSQNFSAVGQFPMASASASAAHAALPAPAAPPVVVPRTPTMNTDLGHGSVAYNHTYALFVGSVDHIRFQMKSLT